MRVIPALGHRVTEGTGKRSRVDFCSGAGSVRWWLSTRTVKVDILDLPPTCQVTSGKLLNLSEPHFPFCAMATTVASPEVVGSWRVDETLHLRRRWSSWCGVRALTVLTLALFSGLADKPYLEFPPLLPFLPHCQLPPTASKVLCQATGRQRMRESDPTLRSLQNLPENWRSWVRLPGSPGWRLGSTPKL